MSAINEDIKKLRQYAAAETRCILDLCASEAGRDALDELLRAVKRVFAPTKQGEAVGTVAPEVARAELAALPVPRRLWDDVLEPLLGMAERATDSELQEAMRRNQNALGLLHDLAKTADQGFDGQRGLLHRANVVFTQLRRLEKHLGWLEGDEQGLVDALIEGWDDRDRLAEAASKVVICWDGEHRAYRHAEAEERLRAALAASPVGQALGKGGGRAVVEPDATTKLVERPIYSDELEQLRKALTRLERPRGTNELLAWAEKVERHVAAAEKGVAVDDEAPAFEVRTRPGDRAEVISAISTGLACDVHVKNARGDVIEIHVLEQGEQMPASLAADKKLIMEWDLRSEAICAALGPYYSDDGAMFDDDKMIAGIQRLREQSEALQQLLSIHETAWPHDVSVQPAKCVAILAKACTSSYCANGGFVAAGGTCPSCGPAQAVPQQTPDPAQDA